MNNIIETHNTSEPLQRSTLGKQFQPKNVGFRTKIALPIKYTLELCLTEDAPKDMRVELTRS